MWIKKVLIRGFGHYYNLEIDEISPGLTLIEGLNEAGKTTFMSFIRAIFFGFSDRRTNQLRYEPLEGGEHGGAITIGTEEGKSYLIDRRPGSSRGDVTVYNSEGDRYGDSEIKHLFKGLTEPVFQQIFCFGLSELQRLESLENEEISGLIYSAGMGIHTRSFAQIQKELNEKQGQLFRPTARKPEINRLLKELSETEEKIKSLKEIPIEYNHLKETTAKLNDRFGELDEILEKLEEEESWLIRLQHASDPFHRLKRLEIELRELPAMNSFPENGIHRLDSLKEKIHLLQSNWKRKELEIQGVEEELKNLEKQISLKNITALLEIVSVIQELLEERRLFQEWKKDLASVKLKLAQREVEVAEFLKDLGIDWTKERVINYSLSLSKREKVRNFIYQNNHLNTAIQQLEVEEKQLAQLKKERELELVKKEDKLETAKRNGLKMKDQAGLSGRILALGSAIMILMLILSGWLFKKGDWLVGGILMGIGLIPGLGSLYLRKFLKLQEKEVKDQDKAKLMKLTTEFEVIKQGVGQIQGELQGILRQKESTIKSRVELLKEWQRILIQDQLSFEMKPEDLLELFKLLERGKDIFHRFDEMKDNQDYLQKKIDIYLEKVNKILTYLNKPQVGLEEVSGIVLHLQEELQIGKDLLIQKKQLEEKLKELKLDFTEIDFQYKTEKEDWTRLLQAGRVDIEEEFRQKWKMYQKREKLLKAKIEWESAFQMVASTKSAEMTDVLEKLGSRDLQEKLIKVQNECQSIKAELAEVQNQLGQLKARLDQIEQTEEILFLQQIRESLITQIDKKSKIWMTYALCQRFLELAKERYEQERQPGVLKEASTFFSMLTAGRFKKVMRPFEENRLEVERADGSRLGTHLLSRGTGEQLYLAMRFALAKEYGKRTMTFPLIMDDILVNFDSQRTESALELMAELAKDQQILFFTCHSHLAPMLKDKKISFSHLKLEKSGIKRI
ncbi:MAG: AAA family ATPase [Halanaerobiales bacterium]|nr:AAA family ATPase [Halanaerobiales bacterium]